MTLHAAPPKPLNDEEIEAIRKILILSTENIEDLMNVGRKYIP